MSEKIKELFRNAVFRGELESLKSLKNTHPEINLGEITYTFSGNTLLHTAATIGHAGIAQFLLATGMNPSTENNHGDTPLNLAAIHQNGAVGAILTNAGGIYGNPAPAHNIVFNDEATGYWEQTNDDSSHQYHLAPHGACNYLCPGMVLTSGDFY